MADDEALEEFYLRNDLFIYIDDELCFGIPLSSSSGIHTE